MYILYVLPYIGVKISPKAEKKKKSVRWSYYMPAVRWFQCFKSDKQTISGLHDMPIACSFNYHHLQKFKTNFQNPTTQWKKQSWKYLLFKNIYFQQITMLYHTLPPLWYEMVTVSYLVCPQLFLMYFKLLKYPQIPRWS